MQSTLRPQSKISSPVSALIAEHRSLQGAVVYGHDQGECLFDEDAIDIHISGSEEVALDDNTVPNPLGSRIWAISASGSFGDVFG